MNQLDKKDNADLDKIDRDINFHRIMVFLILVTAIIFYMIFINLEVTESAQSWGPVGDFFGGILNPIFALFAFYWLTYSVRLQIKELKETREELSKAAKAQKESAKHQKKIARLEAENVKTQIEILALNKDTLKSQQDAAIAQQQQIALQNFESLFFQLLKAKTDITNDIIFEKKLNGVDGIVSFTGKEAIKKGMEGYKKSKNLLDWNVYYQDNLFDYMGSYFRICYRIIKLIDSSEDLKLISNNYNYLEKRKEYFNIFRSTLNQYELEALFYNCLSKYGMGVFKNFSEKYGLFKNILIETDAYDTNVVNKLSRYAYLYETKAFENNEILKKYIIDLDKIKSGLKLEEFEYICNKLVNVGFIIEKHDVFSTEPNGKKLFKYNNMQINSEIVWEINQLIFTEDNINNILGDYIKYKEIVAEINRKKDLARKFIDYIHEIEDYFKAKGEEVDQFKKIEIRGRVNDSIYNINMLILECSGYVSEKNKYLDNINSSLSYLRNSDYTETVLTVIKYKINYYEYWKHKALLEENQQKKSA